MGWKSVTGKDAISRTDIAGDLLALIRHLGRPAVIVGHSLIIMGTEDPDWADPRAEGEAIAAAMPAGLRTVATVTGAGHYPHAQCPDQIAALVIPFLAKYAHSTFSGY
jgi:pimeloyl-ACP methyl ester carboxylesterase